jgi:Uma2 family endonuclease
MTNVKVVLTYRDYAALPNDGRRYEIHDGELSVTPAPGRTHQAVILRLAAALHAHVSACGLGEVYIAPFDVILAETTIVQPDIIFVANDRLGTLSERGAEGAPTLVIEALSPSTTRTDRSTKLQLYARHTVPYYWIVDPDRRVIEVYRLGAGVYDGPETFGDDDLVDVPPLPGLRLNATSLWFPQVRSTPHLG